MLQGVDTTPGSVDTRYGFQQNDFTDCHSVSTQMSTLADVVSTHSGDFCQVQSHLDTWPSRLSHSLCGLSRRAQFGVVVLQVFLESSCSRVFGVVVLQCELYSRSESPRRLPEPHLVPLDGLSDRNALDLAAATKDQIIARGSGSLCFCSSFCIVSRRALVCESSHSLCGLSRRAQFGVAVLQVFLESSCSRVFGVVVLQCELYSRF
ncbi:hypothetical protein Taro_023940 [Colocasia esculenta]|uniref:Uncharacterized protein n=1 Tax=Colocasia esculenta TaxID=4460 RepID=A0A843V531_COLES|nr:hypothetical protein [Colocasia esculenta]